MTRALFTCTKCNKIFRNRHGLDYHVKRDHRSSIKIKFQNGEVIEVKRAEDNIFKCKCGKTFKLPDSLRRHAKRCNNESTESYEEEVEVELMNISDSDASESMDVDDRIIPVDCFGALISHEKC